MIHDEISSVIGQPGSFVHTTSSKTPKTHIFLPLKKMVGRRFFHLKRAIFSGDEFPHFREGGFFFLPLQAHIGSIPIRHKVQELDEARNNYLDAIDLLMDLEDF